MKIEELRSAVKDALSPTCFFVTSQGSLRIEHRPAERIPWEIFRGHLLDERQTRLEKEFESWNVIVGKDDTPTLSVKFSSPDQGLFITRHIRVYAHESYEGEGRAILSREKQGWRQELIGTIDLAPIQEADELRRLVGNYLFRAVVGSRLPITSWESPLPGFSMGWFGYFPSNQGAYAPRSVETPADLLRTFTSPGKQGAYAPRSVEPAKRLELALRAVLLEEVSGLARIYMEEWRAAPMPLRLMQTLFQHVALSPYTGFVENLNAFLDCLVEQKTIQPEEQIDIIGYMLRHLVRHLTAYDLVTFHNFGANYPDALVIDTFLTSYLRLIYQHELAYVDESMDDEKTRQRKRLRRRALRQVWLIRKQYEGLPVPDQPTSPGENLRVMPDDFPRLPEEQLLQPHRRRRRLFADQSADSVLNEVSRRVLLQSIADLSEPTELRELGMATFLDRPLGIFKARGEVDRTPMFSYEAYSQRVAEKRLGEIQKWGTRGLTPPAQQLTAKQVAGISVRDLSAEDRPGVVGLADARKVADDFVFVRTTRSSLQSFLAEYKWEGLKRISEESHHWLTTARNVLLIRSPKNAQGLLMAYDEAMQPRLELHIQNEAVRYIEYDGVEVLAGGFRIEVDSHRLEACATHRRDACGTQ